jgi:hypothetical protein
VVMWRCPNKSLTFTISTLASSKGWRWSPEGSGGM